jgi:hypothetical protein
MPNLEPAEPVVLNERGDVNVFRSIRSLIGHVEAIDVRDGVYEAFDATGRSIVLSAASDRAAVTYTVSPTADPERLRSVLLRFATRPRVATALPPEIDIGAATLAGLLDALLPKEKPRRRWFHR